MLVQCERILVLGMAEETYGYLLAFGRIWVTEMQRFTSVATFRDQQLGRISQLTRLFNLQTCTCLRVRR